MGFRGFLATLFCGALAICHLFVILLTPTTSLRGQD